MQIERRKYYEAYEERYKTAHERGVTWEYMNNTPIVLDIIRRYHISPQKSILEIGCGEGRDAQTLIKQGYSLLATDLSSEAITYCKNSMPGYEKNFRVLDCLSQELAETYDFVYAVSVIHMLVLDEDRNGFYEFIHDHLKADGIGLICSMGDGVQEMQSDISKAFEIQKRNHRTVMMMVAGTSCRMVSSDTFQKELKRNRLKILEEGITSAAPNFDHLMYAVVQKK